MAWNVFCQTELLFSQKSSHNHTWWLSVSCWNAIAIAYFICAHYASMYSSNWLTIDKDLHLHRFRINNCIYYDLCSQLKWQKMGPSFFLFIYPYLSELLLVCARGNEETTTDTENKRTEKNREKEQKRELIWMASNIMWNTHVIITLLKLI